MRLLPAFWLTLLITPLFCIAGQADRAATPKTPPPAPLAPAGPSTAPGPSAPPGLATLADPAIAASKRTIMESHALKQRDAVLAAMQASIDKQRASVAASIADSRGKAVTAEATPFFNLPSLAPPENLPALLTLPEATIPDADCPPVPEAQI